MAKRTKKSGPVAKVTAAHQSFDADVSEAFRRARASIGQITTDLNELRRHAAAAVKAPRRPVKSK